MSQPLKIIIITIVLILCGSHSALAQENNSGTGLRTITGIVIDKLYTTALPGVIVYVKDTNRKTVSDMDGKFSLPVKDGEQLITKYIGFEDAEVSISKDSEYTIMVSELQPGGMGEPVVIETYRRRTFFGRIFHSIGNFFRGKSEFSVTIP